MFLMQKVVHVKKFLATFDERYERYHGCTLYRSSTNVALIVKFYHLLKLVKFCGKKDKLVDCVNFRQFF